LLINKFKRLEDKAMKKHVFIKVFERIVELLKNEQDKIDINNTNDLDIVDEYFLFDDLISKFSLKIDTLQGKSFANFDFFPDWKEENKEMKQNKFFHYINLIGTEFIDVGDVAKMMGWDTYQVYDRLEELPIPVHNGLKKLWAKHDFEHKEQRATLSQVLTVAEAAKKYNVSNDTIIKLCQAKKIAARQTEDGEWLIGREGLHNYFKSIIE